MTTFSYFMDEPDFFGPTTEYLSSSYHTELSCKKSIKSLEPFLSKIEDYQILTTNHYHGDFMGPGDRVAGPKINHRSDSYNKKQW